MESLTGQRKAARWRQEISRCGVDTGVAAPWTCPEMGLAVFTGARGSRFVCDDDGGFGELVATISQRADAPINSCAREAAAEPFLRELGKMSQQQLFDCFQDKTRLGRCPDRFPRGGPSRGLPGHVDLSGISGRGTARQLPQRAEVQHLEAAAPPPGHAGPTREPRRSLAVGARRPADP